MNLFCHISFHSLYSILNYLAALKTICLPQTYQCYNNEPRLEKYTGSLKKYKRGKWVVFSILLKFLFSTGYVIFMLGLISFWLWATFHGFYNLFIKHNLFHYHITYLYGHVIFFSIQSREIKARIVFQVLNFSLMCNLLCFISNHMLTNMHDNIFETFLFTYLYKSLVQIRTLQVTVT